jgi:hypothetical protein
MRWFTFGKEGASLPGKEWATLTKDPEDMLASIALGTRVHSACLRRAGFKVDKEAERTVVAFAHVLHHTLDEMDEERWLELRWHLQEGWRQSEMGLWESPDRSLPPDSKEEKELLPAVLFLQHSMEQVIRPELFRLLWCMLTSSERGTPLQALEMRDAQGGLLFPLMLLEQLNAQNVPRFLDEEEKQGMAYLRSILQLSERVSTDELLDALVSRRYLIQGARLYLEPYLRSEGEWHARTEVLRWRERVLRGCALLFAFRVMFLAAVVGESGALRVSFPE